MEDKYKQALQDLVDAIIESGTASDIEEGLNGNGPVATAMMVLGKTFAEANEAIWGDDWEDEDEDNG